MTFEPGWNWGAAFTGLRRDVNTLAWLFEEERLIQRLYVESVFWALTGKVMTVDHFSREMGFGVAGEGTADVSERAEAGALDGGGGGEEGLGTPCVCRCKEGEAPQV